MPKRRQKTKVGAKSNETEIEMVTMSDVDKRMLLTELFDFCRSESLSEEGIRKIIEQYGLKADDTQNIISNNYGIFLAACRNERVNEGIIRCLLEYFPTAASATDAVGRVSLHYACDNKNVTLDIIHLLIEAQPDSVRCVSSYDESPLHNLCYNREVGETAAVQILKFLLEKHPEAVRRAEYSGYLPIHLAAGRKSPEFCRVLIEAYPGSEQISDTTDKLSLHYACEEGSLAAVEYLYQQYPEAISHATAGGKYPIHFAIDLDGRDNPAAAVEIVQFLLDCDPNQKLKTFRGKSLLYYACEVDYNDSSIDVGIEMIKILYDAHPEAIQDNAFAANIQSFHHQVQEFTRYAREAQDVRLMTTPDDNGQLPLHRALQNNVRLGSIKLLVKGNPSALRTLDYNFALPIHIACEHHDSAAVVKYLLDLDTTSLRSLDIDNNTTLHYACRGAKNDEATAIQTLRLLIEKYTEALWHTNKDGDLPIHLAAAKQSPEFCCVLIEAYPVAQIPNANGQLPLHEACSENTVATVQYLYQKYPDAINHATVEGHYPIHYAISTKDRHNPAPAVEIVRFLLDCDANEKLKQCRGMSLLHYACLAENFDSSDAEIIKIILNAHPESARSRDNNSWMPIHCLCSSVGISDEAAAMQILKLLIEKYTEALRHADSNGHLPIHLAADTQSPEFCRVLIEAYPGSEQIPDTDGALSLHEACSENTVATVQYLYQKYPDAINHATLEGHYPIHYAISTKDRHNPAPAVEIVRFLLDCDPNVKMQQLNGRSLLYYACVREYNETNIEAGIQMIETIFDAHPEAIEDDRMVDNIQRFHQQVREFVNSHLVYARQAKDHRHMTTPGDNGQLPLHRALQNNVRLGSVKLLVKGNPSALRTHDNDFALPLHFACQYHDSTEVIEYLLGLDPSSLDAVDRDENTALHYACRGSKYDAIAMLLEKYDAVSISKRNAHGKLPIELLWESNEVIDRESTGYTESVFKLLRAYPEMRAMSDRTEQQSNDADATIVTISNSEQPVDADATRNGTKRKFGHE